MFLALLAFAASASVIVFAGFFLTKFADEIAELTGFGKLLVGSVLLAGATSLPEVSVDINAIMLGQPNLAVGDLLGSCLCNLLILAVLDLSHFSRGRMLSQQASAHALSGMMTISLVALAVLGMLTKAGVVIAGMGAATIALMVTYICGIRLVFLDQRLAAKAAEVHAGPAPHPGGGLLRALGGFTLAAAVILAAAPFMAHSADQLAELSGLGRSFVGTTLVAFSTSLPEVVSSLAALRLGAYDLALGNIFGSNAFNIVMLAVLDIFQPGSLLAVVAPVNAITGVSVMLVTATAVAGQLYRVESRRAFFEPDASLIVALVIATMWLVYIYG